eukprot:scaffold124364_cov25-Tisochrysis_lutea.AAC.1
MGQCGFPGYEAGDACVGLPKHDVLKAHIARIAELERELRNMRQFHSLRRAPSCAKGERSRRSSAMDVTSSNQCGYPRRVKGDLKCIGIQPGVDHGLLLVRPSQAC